ncbi:hypothetical protein [Wolbachia endosymbiont of Litomosoides brasiliensis]|uniref:hypothetical protein n=1 Tax=Wolbachia endosymbiont of Litomosoides brasiliensis TaxID=1812117 RepID=UPI00158E45E8|nr:hypothetical protein [Wolbachia endosymbiont of Litomosoides brasiliensis]
MEIDARTQVKVKLVGLLESALCKFIASLSHSTIKQLCMETRGANPFYNLLSIAFHHLAERV